MQKAVNSLVSHVIKHGIRHVIICPGSRNAPLTLAFTRNPQAICYSLVDERSAAYTAMGMALALNSPVAIVCTSGTAVLNLYPAICESYYSQIPLLVITADRPPELIDQWDGQCIHQSNIFEKHILGSFTFNPANPHLDLDSAISLCSFPKKGPVHINVPLAEPLYEAKNDHFEYEKLEPVSKSAQVLSDSFPKDFNYKRVMLLAGADFCGQRHSSIIDKLVNMGKVVVIADIISGLHGTQTAPNWDAYLSVANDYEKAMLQPELLISIGKFTISKGLKKFLKQYKPQTHWHVTSNHSIADPFETKPLEISCDENIFLNQLLLECDSADKTYTELWQKAGAAAAESLDQLFDNSTFNEFSAINTLINDLPQHICLQVANSMPIRYVSFLAEKLKNVSIYCNRGTSGIDGSNSTAAGFSMIQNELTLLLTGDLSFFYDINGLWNSYLKPNFKIIVLNNGGGGIFRLIDGPSDLPEREHFFSTSSKRTCKNLAEEFNFAYYNANDFSNLRTEFQSMLKMNDKPAILEIFTDSEKNIEFFKAFKSMKFTTI